MKNNYISPVFIEFNSLEEKKDYFSFHEEDNSLKFEAFFRDDSKHSFIVGEPGCGKSRILEEIKNEAQKFGKKSISVSLPKWQLTKGKTLIQLVKDEDADLSNSKEFVVCFDALDELTSYSFTEAIIQLEAFCKQFPETSIFITCRSHYINTSKHKIQKLTGFTFIFIELLLYQQIENFLNENLEESDQKQNLIQSILTKTSTNREGYSILRTPRYLKVISEIVEKEEMTQEEILSLKRVDFFEKAIYGKLEEELEKKPTENQESKISHNEKEITKRVLEKLALIMEINRVNTITKDELMTFLDDTDSNLNLIFLNTIEIDKFIERVLKLTNDILEFDNTEFQEYLAAKELLRLGRKDQIIYDLAIEKNFNHIYKNWYDVLKYVVELDARQILPIVEFLNSKGEAIIEVNDYFGLINVVDEKQLSEKEKIKIFDYIFSYFQKSQLYIYSFTSSLSNFYQSACYSQHFKEILSIDKNINFENQIFMIGQLAYQNKLQSNELSYWKIKLKEYAGDNFSKESIHVLRYFKDIEVFKEIESTVLFKGDSKIDNTFIESVSEIEPNDDYTIDIILKGLEENVEYSINAISHVDNNDSLLKIIEAFCKEDVYLDTYLSDRVKQFRMYDEIAISISKIDKIDSFLLDALKNLLIKVMNPATINYTYYRDEFIKKLTEIIFQKDVSFILEVVKKCSNGVYVIESIIAKYIKKEQIQQLIEELTIQGNKYWLPTILLNIKNLGGKDEIYEEGRQYLIEEYKVWENPITQPNHQIAIDENTIARFKKALNIGPDIFKIEVFTIYLNNKVLLEDKAAEDVAYLKEIVINVIKNRNLENYKIIITKEEPGSRSFTTNDSLIYYFSYCLKTAFALCLNEEIKPYRRNLLFYLPIASDNLIDAQNISEDIINFLGEISEVEINELASFCDTRTDDFLYTETYSFIKTIKKLKAKQFIPLLNKFVESERLRNDERIDALKALAEPFAQTDIAYFKEFVDKWKEDDTISKELAISANEFLIEKFEDITAIKWRFEKLKELKIESSTDRDFHSWQYTTPNSISTKCLINLSEKGIDFHMDLLVFSLELRKNIKYVNYSNYLQQIIYNFYLTLDKPKYLKDLKTIISVEKYKNENHNFRFHLKQLELELIDKEQNGFSEAINKYNEIKKKKYLPINNVLDLALLIEDAVFEELRVIIESEGLYKPIKDLAVGRKTKDKYINEDLIQKTLNTHIENILLKKGLRETDIYREVELFDGKRTDLLIKYGFVGPIMIELKLLHNPEITIEIERTKYKSKLKQYILATKSQNSFYLIFKIKTGLETHFESLKEEYTDIDGLRIELFDCTKTM